MTNSNVPRTWVESWANSTRPGWIRRDAALSGTATRALASRGTARRATRLRSTRGLPTTLCSGRSPLPYSPAVFGRFPQARTTWLPLSEIGCSLTTGALNAMRRPERSPPALSFVPRARVVMRAATTSSSQPQWIELRPPFWKASFCPTLAGAPSAHTAKSRWLFSVWVRSLHPRLVVTRS